MRKYQPLETFLRDQRASEVAMTFAEIERVLGTKLPPAAHAHRAWWSNNPSNNVMTRSWLAAGYVTERVDMAAERLVFVRKDHALAPPAGMGESPAPRYGQAASGGLVARLRAALGGTVRVAPGVDLTTPTGEVWDAER